MSKVDEGKPRLSLVYKSLLVQAAKVREYGLTKYPGPEDWRTTSREDHYNAALRHIFAALEGEPNDEKSGLPHLAHAATNIMFLIESGDWIELIDRGNCEKIDDPVYSHAKEEKDERTNPWNVFQ